MIEWSPLPDKGLQDRLARILLSWKGTPWASSQCSKGYGVDCIRFVLSVVSEMRRLPSIPCQVKNKDYYVANKEAWWEAYRNIRESFSGSQSLPVTDPLLVFPGDVISVEAGRNGRHVIIVGTRRNTLFHAASGQGVRMTGIANLPPVTGHWRDGWEHWNA